MLKVNTSNTEYGIVNMSAGKTETRATNQLWSMYSFQANGGLNICTKVSIVMAKKPPIARTGLVARYVDTISGAPATRSSPWGRPASPAAADSHGQPAAWRERYRGDQHR